MIQQGKTPKTHLVRRGALTPLGQFCVRPIKQEKPLVPTPCQMATDIGARGSKRQMAINRLRHPSSPYLP